MAKTDVIDGLRRIYVDANIFIYFAEGYGAGREAATALLTQALERGIQLVTGEITITECLHGAFKQGNEPLASVYRDMFSNTHLIEMVAAEPVLYEYAALAGSMFSLKLVDAVHVASAVIAECDALLTNDTGIRGPEVLKLIRLSEVM